MERESMEYDVLIVGGGPSGLAAAIKLKQLAQQKNQSLSLCLLEKGAEVGSHNLSGAVLEPYFLNQLLPDWHQAAPHLGLPVTTDNFSFLTKQKMFRLPTPKTMKNEGNYIISLSQLCRYLAIEAESLGVEIYPGFPASDIMYDNDGQVIGVVTGDMGINSHGEHTDNYQAGMQLLAKQTLFAEGCRGYLTEKLIKRFNLRQGKELQSYGIGLKEIWQVKKNTPGKVIHTIGWPLINDTYGGSFIYHLNNNRVAVGFVVGLDYKNPYLDPFNEFQRFKTHPQIKPLFVDGERLFYGARALNEGGYQAIPKLTFPGGLLIGDGAGFLNVGKIKGIHNAIGSGMLAAECVFENLKNHCEIKNYETKLKQSTIYKELYQVRNLRPAFHYGLWAGLLYSAIDQYLFCGKAPWTLHFKKADNLCLTPSTQNKQIHYPKPDGKLTFDKTSSLYLSGTFHEENQPCHLVLKDKTIAIETNLAIYDAPETRYCPAGVYEIIYDENKKPHMQINFQNCLHCKTCDIKDLKQNIVWKTPEGGGGPNYTDM